MSIKAKVTGVTNTATGLIVRLIVAALVVVVIWFVSAWVIDFLLNFLATGTYDGRGELKYSSDQPIFMGIRGFLCAVIAFFLLKGRKS